jgi:hypothetical protein
VALCFLRLAVWWRSSENHLLTLWREKYIF